MVNICVSPSVKISVEDCLMKCLALDAVNTIRKTLNLTVLEYEKKYLTEDSDYFDREHCKKNLIEEKNNKIESSTKFNKLDLF